MFHLNKVLNYVIKPVLTFRRNVQVTVIGASNPVGQSVSLLLKDHPLIRRLLLYDVSDQTFGIGMDISHIPTEPLVEGWTGRMEFALRCTDIAVVACGNLRSAKQTDYELFKANADAIISSMQEVAAHCPSAFVVIATEPINHTVPLASKVLECGDSYDKCKVFGVTGTDIMRAQTWLGATYQYLPHLFRVPVICGHSSKTILPLFSHVIPPFDIRYDIAKTMTERIRNVESEIISLKGGSGVPVLSTAYASFCLVSSILYAMNGYPMQHTAFVANNDYGTKYFAGPIIIGRHGIEVIINYKVITALEADYIYASTDQLCKDVYEGESYFKPAKDFPRHVKTHTGLRFIKTL